MKLVLVPALVIGAAACSDSVFDGDDCGLSVVVAGAIADTVEPDVGVSCTRARLDTPGFRIGFEVPAHEMVRVWISNQTIGIGQEGRGPASVQVDQSLEAVWSSQDCTVDVDENERVDAGVGEDVARIVGSVTCAGPLDSWHPSLPVTVERLEFAARVTREPPAE